MKLNTSEGRDQAGNMVKLMEAASPPPTNFGRAMLTIGRITATRW
jgi:hypothetical protein